MKLTLETERLILRPFRMEDAEAMYSGWASDPEATRYLAWRPHDSIETTRDVIAQWIREYKKPERLNFAIVLKDGDRLIGGIDVVDYCGGTPVIGYASAKQYWNNGYMTEACRRLLQYLFSHGFTEARIDAMVENRGSNRVIQKCGGILLRTEEKKRPSRDDTVFLNKYVIYARDLPTC